jgi:hypothetical protein
MLKRRAEILQPPLARQKDAMAQGGGVAHIRAGFADRNA